MAATPFPELNRLLTDFVGRAQSILGPSLIGAYLTGSFAVGSGDRASDCDFLVVTEERVAGDHELSLRELHAEIPDRPSYWARNLEGSYAPKHDLRMLTTIGRPWLYVNRGGKTMEWSAHCNAEDVRWVLRERPLTLCGLDAREFVAEIPATALQRKMLAQIETFLDDLMAWADFEISWTQRYAVEASARMLYTLENGAVISKQHALDWATQQMPSRWRPLLAQVRRDRFVRWNDPPRPRSVEATLAFVEYVQTRAVGTHGP